MYTWRKNRWFYVYFQLNGRILFWHAISKSLITFGDFDSIFFLTFTKLLFVVWDYLIWSTREPAWTAWLCHLVYRNIKSNLENKQKLILWVDQEKERLLTVKFYWKKVDFKINNFQIIHFNVSIEWDQINTMVSNTALTVRLMETSFLHMPLTFMIKLANLIAVRNEQTIPMSLNVNTHD